MESKKSRGALKRMAKRFGLIGEDSQHHSLWITACD